MDVGTSRSSVRAGRNSLTDRFADGSSCGPSRIGELVLVGAEDVGGDARVADRRRGLEVAEGDRDLAVREEALHVVDPLGAHLHVDQAPKRAALDAVRRQVKGVDIGAG